MPQDMTSSSEGCEGRGCCLSWGRVCRMWKAAGPSGGLQGIERCTAFCHPMCHHPQLAHHMLLQKQGRAIQPSSGRTCSTQSGDTVAPQQLMEVHPESFCSCRTPLLGTAAICIPLSINPGSGGLILPAAGAVSTGMLVPGIPADTCQCWVLNY